MTEYIYDAAWEQERARLQGLQEVADPQTIRVLTETIGVEKGWRCLEVGGGGGSIAQWLSDQVGTDGHVVATDLDTRFLATIDADNLEVRTHNIVADELEENSFDLVHSRFLLEHLPNWPDVMKKMTRALKPGGWLVAEDVDFASALVREDPSLVIRPAEAAPLFQKLWVARDRFMEAAGIDVRCGRTLAATMLDQGLGDVGAWAGMRYLRGGSPEIQTLVLTVTATRARLVANGVAAADVDRLLELVQSDSFGAFSPLIVSAWGRRAR